MCVLPSIESSAKGGAHPNIYYLQDGASARVVTIFRDLCTELGLEPDLIQDLILENQVPEDDPTYSSPPLPFAFPETAFRPTPELRCPHARYPLFPLSALNTPVYVATDSRNPRVDPLLAIFRNSLPCVFFQADFRSKDPDDHYRQTPVPELEFLMERLATLACKFFCNYR